MLRDEKYFMVLIYQLLPPHDRSSCLRSRKFEIKVSLLFPFMHIDWMPPLNIPKKDSLAIDQPQKPAQLPCFRQLITNHSDLLGRRLPRGFDSGATFTCDEQQEECSTPCFLYTSTHLTRSYMELEFNTAARC